MDGSSSDDPFTWGIEDVISSLCVQGKPWARDVDKLAKQITDEEVDGNTLLTYEYIYSQRDLMYSLAIKPAGQKAALGHFIKALRARSVGFQKWRRLQDEEVLQPQAGAQEAANNSEAISGLRSPTATSPRESSLKLLDGDDTMTETMPEGGDGIPRKRKLETPEAAEPLTFPPDLQEQVDTAEPKRRRIAPLNLAVQPLNDPSTSFIPTDADNITMRSQAAPSHASPYPWEKAGTIAYLGEGMLERSTIRSTTEPTSSFVTDINDEDFYVAANCSIPTGRRLVVKRFMLGYLQKNSRKEAAVATGAHEMVSSETASDADTVYSLEDLADKYDEETWREIQAEREELEARAAAEKERYLNIEQVVAVVEEAIHEMEEYWNSVKLPKYSQKAYELWTKAVRQGSKSFIWKAQRQASQYDARINKLSAAIKEQKWTKKSELRAQTRSLEGNLEDKLYNLWLIELYSSRVPPTKVSTTRRVVPRPRVPKAVDFSGEEDEEILSSDDDDFVVPDEPEVRDSLTGDREPPSIPDDDDMPIYDAPVEVKSEMDVGEDAYIDLTQMETPRVLTPLPDHSFSGLITPNKPAKQPSTTPGKESAPTPKGGLKLTLHPQEALESYSNVDAIGKESWRWWADRSDPWRLVICLLWRLGSHARRQGVLSAMEDEDADVVYARTIPAHLLHPLPIDDIDKDFDRAVAYDVTRLFLSCLKCKAVRDSRIESVIPRDEKLLKDSKDSFKSFHGFLKRVAPYFPEESQIFRPEAFDEELGLVDDDPGLQPSQHESPSKRRSKKGKEVIRDKEGLDLRERAKSRAEEQEETRQKLHQKLLSMGTLSSDRARLIINDTKKENQDLIYVHEHMAKQIKDHQIEGVKFMWNHILLDQGCLLAHTMGLGKTLQVITLLVAIVEASKSDNESIRSQVPHSLRKSQTLVLCPAALVENWQDELLMWAPRDMLGPLFKVDASLYESERTDTIRTWSIVGGVLIIGYNMFKQMVDDEAMHDILVERPNIVVADEAHNMKNPGTKLNQACSEFYTKSRIALTGTPLANNVEEYHAMIDWVAPNFLGPISEFRDVFARPIQQGLYKDSSGWEKRKALKYLHTLKETVAPKMHRATMNCMRNDLPLKEEFVISLAPSELQRELYSTYIEGLAVEGYPSKTENMPKARIFDVVHHLGLICNHPLCFRQKVEEKQKDLVENGKPDPFPHGVMTKSLELTATANNPFLSGKIEYLLLILEQSRQAGEKVLVFSHSKITLMYLERLLKGQQRRVARLDGSTGVSQRQDDIKHFNSSNLEVYLISTRAGGIGLNIQSASRVVLFDGKWNPVDDQQAIGRAWRIGQQKPVFVYRLLVAGTFEEDLHMKSVFKQQLSSRLIDKKNPLSWANRASQLVHPIKDRQVKELGSFRDKDHILRKLIDHKRDGSIREVMTTETFEEEDEKDTLTAEEREEAEDLAVLNRLRREDPAEYDRRMTMRAVEAQTIHRNPQHVVPPPPSRPIPQQFQQLAADAAQARAESHRNLSRPSTLVEPPSIPHQSLPAEENRSQVERQQPHEPFPGATNFTGSGAGQWPVGEASQSKKPAFGAHEPQVSLRKENIHSQPLASPSTPGPPSRNMDGAADSPIIVDSDSEGPRRSIKAIKIQNFGEFHRGASSLTRAVTRNQTPPGPLPITGANTFIRQQIEPQNQVKNKSSPQHQPHSPRLPSPPQREQADSTQNRLFLHLPHASTRETFNRRLAERTGEIQILGYPMTSGFPNVISDAITEAINQKLVEEGNGFLPDSRRWRLLLDSLCETRFVVALISGLWTTKFVALAKKEDLEHRIKTANSFTEGQFRQQVSQKLRNETDERGLLSKWTGMFNQAETETQQAPDESASAAEEQTEQIKPRAFRLPSWANRALSESSRGSTPRNEVPST